ncbi:hypothetical protein [Paenibacillus elgii]|nr:hypothetical protein [Paenibacillus elgii]
MNTTSMQGCLVWRPTPTVSPVTHDASAAADGGNDYRLAVEPQDRPP